MGMGGALGHFAVRAAARGWARWDTVVCRGIRAVWHGWSIGSIGSIGNYSVLKTNPTFISILHIKHNHLQRVAGPRTVSACGLHTSLPLERRVQPAVG